MSSPARRTDTLAGGEFGVINCRYRNAPACAEPLRRRQGVRNVVRNREIGRLGDGEIEQGLRNKG